MELDRIEEMLDAYFEGQTGMEEEKMLVHYFTEEIVAPHLLLYKPIFVGLSAMRKEESNNLIPIQLEPKERKVFWAYAMTVLLVLGLGIGMFYKSDSVLTAEEKEALAAFEETKEALKFMSEKFNQGSRHLSYLEEFDYAKGMIFKEE